MKLFIYSFFKFIYLYIYNWFSALLVFVKDRAHVRIIIAALTQWQRLGLQFSSVLLCLLDRNLTLGSKTQEYSISLNIQLKFSPFLFLR